MHVLDNAARGFTRVLHILVWTALLACGRDSQTKDGIPTGGRFRVALLTPGPISDQSWNAGAYRGLRRIRDSLGATISHIQVKTPADIEENLRQYGTLRYKLVFGHGFEFQDPASRIGPQFPRTTYIVTSGNRVTRNVAPLVFGFEDASYLAGMVAGALTRSGVIGTIGGTELPPVKSSFLAFVAGAKALRPDVQVLSSYIGNWDDASAGKELALAQIRRGADYIFQNADAAGLGIFQAAKESPGVRVFGSNSNQNDVAPDVVIASVVIDLPLAFITVAREVKDGGFKPRVIVLGSKTGVVSFVLNPRLAHLITPGLQAQLDSVRILMATGQFQPPRIDFVDSAKTNAPDSTRAAPSTTTTDTARRDTARRDTARRDTARTDTARRDTVPRDTQPSL